LKDIDGNFARKYDRYLEFGKDSPEKVIFGAAHLFELILKTIVVFHTQKYCYNRGIDTFFFYQGRNRRISIMLVKAKANEN
jgi:hypothetical protein